jgi:hypothetical protein
MASPHHLDEKVKTLLAATVLYSDIPKDALPAVMRKVEVAVKIHLQQDLAVNGESIYDLASRIVMAAERRASGESGRDALTAAVSLHRPLNGNTTATFLDLQAMVDQEAQEEQFSDFTEALAYLAEQLPAREYSYLLQLLVQRPTTGGFNLLTEGYARENLPRIRQKLHLVMRLFPDLDPTGQLYQLDLDSAMEKYVQGAYSDILQGMQRRFPRDFFTAEDKKIKGRILTRMMVERVAGIRIGEMKVGIKDFEDNKLYGMISKVYGCSSSTALEDAYGHLYRRWELAQRTGQRYWSDKTDGKERRCAAIRWLVEERLKWTLESGKKITAQDFYEHGLWGMFVDHYNSSPTTAIMDAYPGKYHPWQIGTLPHHYWNGEQGRDHARMATRWLVEEKLKWKLEEAVKISRRHFHTNGFHYMLIKIYNQSARLALLDAYPGKFQLKGRSMLTYIGDVS